MSWKTVDDGFAEIKGCNDELFNSLWRQGRLKYDAEYYRPDAIDQVNARLLCAAIEAGQNLLILQPDYRPHRAPLLFATAILRYWLDHKNASCLGERKSILYFGNNTGIREQLGLVEVSNGRRIVLSEVFEQQDVTRRGSVGHLAADVRTTYGQLPRVRTVYSPADPASLLEQYKPCFIAVDCSDAPSLPWCEALLDHAHKRNIATIAWGQNPLGEYVESFCHYGSAFTWPPLPIRCSQESLHTLHDIQQNLLEPLPPEFAPAIIESESILQISTAIKDASIILGAIARNASGRLALDAIRIHWRYLRSLEALCVPFDFHEAETDSLWGVSPLSYTHRACERFSEALRPSAVALSEELTSALSLLDNAADSMRESQPLWHALCATVLEDTAPDEVHLVVFPTAARKRLFIYALLAYNNITEEDIQTGFRTWCITLDDLKHLIQWGEMNLPEHPYPDILLHGSHRLTFVGIPGRMLTPRVLPLLRYQRVEALLYPHQLPSLRTRTRNWSEIFFLERLVNLNTLNIIAPSHPICGSRSNMNYIRVLLPSAIDVKALEHKSSIKLPLDDPVFSALDDIEELTRILETKETEPTNVVSSLPSNPADAITIPGGVGLEWSDTAIELTAAEGFRVLFAPDDIVQLVIKGSNGEQMVDERYVQSIQSGDRIVVIHGQRRQSLYDLIISRVHQLPAIQLHLALINRWHEDLRAAFHTWAAQCPVGAEHPLDALLRAIQEKGSTISCTLSVFNWITGAVRCPHDPDDMKRAAEVLDMRFVTTNSRKIYEAGCRLSGIHRGLSIRLNHWLTNAAQGITDQDDGTPIDDRLGLTFGDFRNSLQFLHVTGIRTAVGPFLRSELGMIER